MATVRSAVVAAVGALVLGGSVFGLATAAQAHNYLVSSSPSAGETLTALPELFEITTNEPLLDSVGLGSFALEVVDEAGLYYGDGCVAIAGPTMSAPAALGAPGEYTVIWQVVSADGHTVSAEFPFTWAPADPAAAVVSTGSSSAPECDATSGDDTDGSTTESSGTSGSDTTDTGSADSPAETPGDTQTDTDTVDLSTVLWVGGAVVLVGATIGVTLLLSGRKKK